LGDEAITKENMQKLAEMTPAEIKEAREQILQTIGIKHPNALK